MAILKKEIGVLERALASSTTCEDTSNYIRGMHITCGRPAVTTVYHERDRKSYAMCEMCADHNINNRDGQEVEDIRGSH